MGENFRDSTLDFRVEIEKRVDAVAQLCLDLLATAFEDVHRHLRFVAVLERNRRGVDARDFVGRKQPQTVYQY